MALFYRSLAYGMWCQFAKSTLITAGQFAAPGGPESAAR